MKRVILMSAVIMMSVSCGDTDPARDPYDITGFYNVSYRVYVDGEPDTSGVVHGRVEVVGNPEKELAMAFYPDSDIIKLPPTADGIPLAFIPIVPIVPEGAKGNYTFEFEGTFEVTTDRSCSAEMTASGSIVAKKEGETASGGGSASGNDSASGGGSARAVATDGPGLYNEIDMTIEMAVPLEGAAVGDGNAVCDVIIDINSDRFPDRRP